MDYARPQAFLPESLRSAAFYQPNRPQERNWMDRQEPDPAALGQRWTAWTAAHPAGGELPVDLWAEELGCSREALARGLGRLAGGAWKVARRLVAEPGGE
jgi:hypothetical protein